MKQTNFNVSSRDLETRVREHLNFNSLQNSAIESHIMFCSSCFQIGFGLDNFSTIRKCQSDYYALSTVN